MNRQKTFLVFALVLLSACGVSWQTLNKNGFTVEMPGSSNEQTQSVSTPAGSTTVNVYAVQAKGEVFMISHNEYPAALAGAAADPQQFLTTVSEGALRNVNGKVSSSRSITLNGKPGRESVGETGPPQEGAFTYRIYWDNPRLYQVLYIRPKGTPSSENGEKFLSSFQLTGK